MDKNNTKIEIYEEPSVDEFLEYLNDWRTTHEIKERFNFSTTKWFNTSRWYMKAKLIERCSTLVNNKTNRVYMFKRSDK
jgi:hypothetical protein